MWQPGLDQHEWESEFQTLEPELRSSPRDALPEFADLVERMLSERGWTVDDPVARAGEEREVLDDYAAARDIATRVERGEDVGPSDVGQAIENLRAVYDYVIAERPAGG